MAQNSCNDIFPIGTPLPSIIDSLKLHNECISVMSFNLLAPLYVRTIDKRTGEPQPFAAFEWVKDDSLLEWSLRKNRLLEVLKNSGAQVICVQELQLERSSRDEQSSFQIPTWLDPIVEECGYEAILPSSEQLELIAERNVRVLGTDAAVTCAVLVQSKHWDVVQEGNRVGENDDAIATDSNTWVSVCLEKKENPNVDPIVVTSVHLDATSEQIRIQQVAKGFERAQTLLDSVMNSKQQTSNKNGSERSIIIQPTVIIAGDMNAEFKLGSCMHSMLQQQCQANEEDTMTACAEALRLSSSPTEKQLEEWNELQTEASQLLDDYCVSLNRVDTGATRCAYSHDDDATLSSLMESWKLDHILYTNNRLSPLARWSTLESDDESSSVGLPNAHCPSDHLPIASIFKLQPNNAQLDQSLKKKTLQQLVELSTAQKKALENVDAVMDAKNQEILKKLPDPIPDACRKERKQKKKKKKAPPPQEIIDLIREKRTWMKKLKQQQQCEREKLVRDFSQLQRLVVREQFGIGWKEWIKKGP